MDQTPSSPLPPLAEALSNTGGPSATATPATSRPVRRRENMTTAACDACRRHKTKCTGERPACQRCVLTSRRCRYSTRQGETHTQALKRTHETWRSQAETQEAVLHLLRTLPEQNANDVFNSIRSGTDLETIVRRIHNGNPTAQLAVVPETRYRYEFPYLTEMPPEYVHDNPYLKSLIFEAATLFSSNDNQARMQFTALEESNSSGSAARADTTVYEDRYTKPFHAAHVVHPLINDTKPSLWTSICTDDRLMRQLLEQLFLCDYSMASAFHMDLFLEDMIHRREDFCSPLLVNVVLAHACMCFPKLQDRAEYWNPNTLIYRFLAEAKRLWELEATRPRLTTIQAGIIFNFIYNVCGMDEIGQVYKMNSVKLAQNSGLFDGPIQDGNDRLRKGKIFTAWALYSWEALVAFSFMQPSSLKQPPHDPLPNPLVHPEWYGETWVRYPLSQTRSSSYFGAFFYYRAELRSIMNRVSNDSYAHKTGLSVDEAYEYYSQMTIWYNSLPEPLQAKNIVLPAQLQLHMYYHHLLLTLFEPHIHVSGSQAQLPTTQQIVKLANVQLHTLIRLYHLRHGYEAMDSFVMVPLTLAGYKCLEAISQQLAEVELATHVSTLILVVSSLYKQSRNCYLAEVLYKVLRSKMRPQEIALLKTTVALEDQDEENQILRQAVRSHWPVSIVKTKDELESQVLSNLVESLTTNDATEST